MRTPMHNSRRPVQRPRRVTLFPPRALEDTGFDALDDWMVACPASEPPQAAD
jgi:hypothetical protein